MADWQAGAEWSCLAATIPQKYKHEGIILHISVYKPILTSSYKFYNFNSSPVDGPMIELSPRGRVLPRTPSSMAQSAVWAPLFGHQSTLLLQHQREQLGVA